MRLNSMNLARNPPYRNLRMQAGETEEYEKSARMNSFKQFDSVEDVGDHKFVQLKKDEIFGDKVLKRIMKDWKLLAENNNLPETIYVRAYEKRIDLLRACIIGAAGTPYHDGLFFFDIKFPANYPAQPPQVHYKSYGLRINPNLYANGTVCLSLLNTWTGTGDERWNMEKSTILQVLVSIQALVLNEKPFYNEPINELLPDWRYFQKKALLYNEGAFMLSCMTMTYTLNRPPMHFQEFVSSHFRGRAPAIVTACIAYTSGGVRVGGPLTANGPSSSSSSKIDVSKNFQKTMCEIYPKLLQALTENGASVGHFVKQLEVKKEKAERKVGFTKGVLNMVKKMFGFKKFKKTTK